MSKMLLKHRDLSSDPHHLRKSWALQQVQRVRQIPGDPLACQSSPVVLNFPNAAAP